MEQHTDDVSRFYRALENVNAFHEQEVRGVMETLVLPNEIDSCFLGIYHRSVLNAQTMLALNDSRHIQATAMLARSLFELSVDFALLDVVMDGPRKMLAFARVDKLRMAKRELEFGRANPAIEMPLEASTNFVSTNEIAIDADRAALWPGVKPSDLRHWTALSLEKRVTQLGMPFVRIHAFYYPKLSLYVHSGVTGWNGIDFSGFRTISGSALSVALISYIEVLAGIVKKYQIDSVDQKLLRKLRVAQMMSFTDSDEELRAVVEHWLR